MCVVCPRCKQPLFLEVTHVRIFAIEDISISNVKERELVDTERILQLKCMNCDFEGWLDQYYDETEGIRPLFDKKGVFKCTCSLKQ